MRRVLISVGLLLISAGLTYGAYYRWYWWKIGILGFSPVPLSSGISYCVPLAIVLPGVVYAGWRSARTGGFWGRATLASAVGFSVWSPLTLGLWLSGGDMPLLGDLCLAAEHPAALIVAVWLCWGVTVSARRSAKHPRGFDVILPSEKAQGEENQSV
jgi:hypothetical protein